MLKKVVTLLLVAMMVVSMTGCSKDTPETKEVVFRYAIGGVPSSLDLGNGGESVSAYITNQTSFGYYHIGPDGSMVADSVKDVAISDDGLTYTFTLVENHWSDGQKVTSTDFVNGIKHALSLPAALCTYKEYVWNYVDGLITKYGAMGEDAYTNGIPSAEIELTGVETPDEDTIVFHLTQRCEFFTSLLSLPPYYPQRADFAVDGETTWANDAAVPTNGAFKFETVDLNGTTTMVKNDQWCNASKVTVDKLVCSVVEDMDAELMQFKADELDFACAVDGKNAYEVFGASGEAHFAGAINYYITLNQYMGAEALKDVKVRRAIQLATNREQICDALDTPGMYYPLKGFLPKGVPTGNGDWLETSEDLVYFNVEEARQLMAEAGYPNAGPDNIVLELTYSFNSNTMHDTVAAVLSEQLKQIGIKLNIDALEWRSWSDKSRSGLYDMGRGAFSADFTDPTTFLNLGLYGTQTNHTRSTPEYDKMIEAANLLSGADRVAALQAAEKYLIEENCSFDPLFGYSTAILCKNYVTGWQSNPQGNEVFWYITINK